MLQWSPSMWWSALGCTEWDPGDWIKQNKNCANFHFRTCPVKGGKCSREWLTVRLWSWSLCRPQFSSSCVLLSLLAVLQSCCVQESSVGSPRCCTRWIKCKKWHHSISQASEWKPKVTPKQTARLTFQHELTTLCRRLPSAWSPWWFCKRSSSLQGWSELWWVFLRHLRSLSYGCQFCYKNKMKNKKGDQSADLKMTRKNPAF